MVLREYWSRPNLHPDAGLSQNMLQNVLTHTEDSFVAHLKHLTKAQEWRVLLCYQKLLVFGKYFSTPNAVKFMQEYLTAKKVKRHIIAAAENFQY
jgi:hypothetical protein